MTPIAMVKGLSRRVFPGRATFRIRFAAALLALPSVYAGDAAERRAIGFSPDGRYFAFQQSGIQDGSGFPYSDLFVLDVHQNKWVPGTPVHVRFDDDSRRVEEARTLSVERTLPLLRRLQVNHPVVTLVSNPLTEIGNDPHDVSFFRYPAIPGGYVGPRYRLILKEQEVQATPKPRCRPTGVTPKVFRLLLQVGDQQAGPLVSDDDFGPLTGTGCPIGYGISDVFAPRRDTDTLVVLLNVFSHGFEGPDRRYTAVAAHTPAP